MPYDFIGNYFMVCDFEGTFIKAKNIPEAREIYKKEIGEDVPERCNIYNNNFREIVAQAFVNQEENYCKYCSSIRDKVTQFFRELREDDISRVILVSGDLI